MVDDPLAFTGRTQIQQQVHFPDETRQGALQTDQPAQQYDHADPKQQDVIPQVEDGKNAEDDENRAESMKTVHEQAVKRRAAPGGLVIPQAAVDETEQKPDSGCRQDGQKQGQGMPGHKAVQGLAQQFLPAQRVLIQGFELGQNHGLFPCQTGQLLLPLLLDGIQAGLEPGILDAASGLVLPLNGYQPLLQQLLL